MCMDVYFYRYYYFQCLIYFGNRYCSYYIYYCIYYYFRKFYDIMIVIQLNILKLVF